MAGSRAEVAPPGPAGQDGLSRVVRARPGRPTRPVSHRGRSPHHSLRPCLCSKSHVLPDSLTGLHPALRLLSLQPETTQGKEEGRKDVSVTVEEVDPVYSVGGDVKSHRCHGKQ